jgi:hypothetical protein
MNESDLAQHFKGAWQPLINGDDRLVLIWSPKAACTSLLIWHFHRLGILKAARMYSGWPHAYRADVLNRTESVRTWIRRLDRSYRFLRVIRDPYRRAVSGYRHSLRYGLLRELPDGRSLDPEAGYSFRDFLRALSEFGPTNLDGHFRPQCQSLESKVPCRVINADAEDLFARLNAFERELGLTPTDFAAIGWFDEVARIHNSSFARTQEVVATGDTRLTGADAQRRWPGADALLSAPCQSLVRRVYRVDFEAYAAYLDESFA